jgi:hypothetical protein
LQGHDQVGYVVDPLLTGSKRITSRDFSKGDLGPDLGPLPDISPDLCDKCECELSKCECNDSDQDKQGGGQNDDQLQGHDQVELGQDSGEGHDQQQLHFYRHVPTQQLTVEHR